MGSGSYKLLQKPLSLLSVCHESEYRLGRPLSVSLSIWPCCS